MKTRTKPNTVKPVYCNTCGISTPHTLKDSSFRGKYDVRGKGPGEQLEFWEEHEYLFWVCQICETAALEINWSNMGIEYALEETGGNGISTWYPPPERFVPKKFRRLRKRSLKSLYSEVIASYNSDLRLLCASGLRSLLEGICIDMGIEDKGKTWALTGKLRALKERGLVTEEIADNLVALKFVGDDAIHQLETPTEEELGLGIRIVESLISFLYKEAEYQLSSQVSALAEIRKPQVGEHKRKEQRRKESKGD